MSPDSRTPVLVGAGAVQEHLDDPARAAEPVELMISALERAAEDAGSRELLARADAVCVSRGFWDYPDPGRLVAERFGASTARSVLAEIGVLQTTLLGRAALDIQEGRADVVLVTGGDAKYRMRGGGDVPFTEQPAGAAPDLLLRPEREIISAAEVRAGLAMPVTQYAMIDNALRAAEGISLEAHEREVADLWAGMSFVAAANPDAWSREVVEADAIRTPGERNRMLAFPYTRHHTSQWNVNQAAGLVFCSRETAGSLGIPRERWVFPLAVADSNHVLPLSERPRIHRSPGFARAGARVLEHSARSAAEVAHLELYSCFPAAVRVQLRELGISPARPLTVTGGMAFAGGPLNNFVFQALARMAGVLRDDPGSAGLVTAVSGMLTKQGASLWSTEPAAAGFRFDDVTEDVARETRAVSVVESAEGPATLVTYTVLYEGAKPSRAVLLCDLPDRSRALVACSDEALAEAGTREELCGRAVRLLGGGRVELA